MAGSLVVSNVIDGICKSTTFVGPSSRSADGVRLRWFEITSVNTSGVGLRRRQAAFVGKLGVKGGSVEVSPVGEGLGNLRTVVQDEF